MSLIEIAIKRPIAIIAAVCIIILFGLLALKTIPIQLTPDINRPVIEITTLWPGNAPADVEREIINKQEDELKGLDGLQDIFSQASTGRASITLEFSQQQDMNKALLLVSNRLDRVLDYPEEADKPSLKTASSEDSPIAWFTLKITDETNQQPIHTYGTLADDIIREKLERVPGVGNVNIYGGSEQEMQVIIDANVLAHYKLTLQDMIDALNSANTSISAGDIDEGKRRYVIRTEADFQSIQQVENVVIKSTRNQKTGHIERIHVRDIAKVQLGYKEPTARIRHLGNPTIAMNTVREAGANVIETMEGIRAAVKELNEEILPKFGISLTQVYDETDYINSAIDLVQKNIIIGGLLASGILLIFLKNIRATLIIAFAIPISIIGSFVAMAGMGRSINVISLAGLAFAVGMVIDAAIIVLENIYRHRQQGLTAKQAALQGSQEVWGAIFVSALTTVMVFVPLIVLNLEIAQLFRDIAVAISVSVILSLFVAITIIPGLSAYLFANDNNFNSPIHIPMLDNLAKKFSNYLITFLKYILQQKKLAIFLIVMLTCISILGTKFLLPKLEYLPEGNRNLIFGIITPPPGYNLDTTLEIAKRIEAAARPLWASETGPESPPGTLPKIKNYFFVARNNITFVGATAVQANRVTELIPVLRRPIFKEPGTYGFISQSSLFGRSIGSGRVIDVDISGPDLEVILKIALQTMQRIEQLLPQAEGNQFRPIPGLELGAPEVRVIPNNVHLMDNGLSNLVLASSLKVFNDGLRIAEITVNGKRIDLMLMGPDGKITQTQQIKQLPIITADGKIVPVSSLADVFLTSGPTEIRHKDRVRTITIQVRPSATLPLELAMEKIQQQVITPLNQAGLPDDTSIRLTGTADKLTETWDAMVVQLAIALIIVYLIMSVLFESFFYPLIILFSVPVAAIGGVLGLATLNLFIFQPLDMLTLLGFVILVGIVVNNAILIVHYTLQHRQMNVDDAILKATQDRVRPIFMSTLTSIFGMFPLVLFPGAGAELYRGLGSVILGGLSLSAILTLIIIPVLLKLTANLSSCKQ